MTPIIRAGAPHAFISTTLPMTQYATRDEILRAAIKAAEAGADAIQTPRSLEVVEMLVKEGLSVQGHLGLVPRRSTQVGGLRVIGKTAHEALELLEDFRRLEEGWSLSRSRRNVLQTTHLEEIRHHSRLVIHSIGAGSAGDVILLYLEDICGDVENPPRHARAFGDLRSIRKELANERLRALQSFKDAVLDGDFPGALESVSMPENEHSALQEALAKRTSVHS